MFLIKITFFGAKNQIIQVIFPFKNSQKSWLFSLKIQVQNFEFLDIIFDFLTECSTNFSDFREKTVENYLFLPRMKNPVLHHWKQPSMIK